MSEQPAASGKLHPAVPGRGAPENPFYMPLTMSAQTAYAQLFDSALATSLHRSVANLTGSFAKKTVAGKEYWYFQYRELREFDEQGRVQQIYLGPRSERLDALIEAKQKVEKGQSKVPVTDQLAMLARSAKALGNFAVPNQQLKVLKRIGDYGYFNAGGVLVGTHAFACYGNMFGVAWGNFMMTHDLDFAYGGRNLSVALGANVKLDLHDAITSLEMGFLPSSKLDGLAGGTYVSVAMVPLKFMEFSLRDIQQAVVLADTGAVLVNIPNPARFALHKLIVAGERGPSFQTKVTKDLWQAAALLTYLVDYAPRSLADAWIDLQGRGKGWKSRFDAGMKSMVRTMPYTAQLPDRCEEIVAERLAELAEDEDGQE